MLRNGPEVLEADIIGVNGICLSTLTIGFLFNVFANLSCLFLHR